MRARFYLREFLRTLTLLMMKILLQICVYIDIFFLFDLRLFFVIVHVFKQYRVWTSYI